MCNTSLPLFKHLFSATTTRLPTHFLATQTHSHLSYTQFQLKSTQSRLTQSTKKKLMWLAPKNGHFIHHLIFHISKSSKRMFAAVFQIRKIMYIYSTLFNVCLSDSVIILDGPQPHKNVTLNTKQKEIVSLSRWWIMFVCLLWFVVFVLYKF